MATEAQHNESQLKKCLAQKKNSEVTFTELLDQQFGKDKTLTELLDQKFGKLGTEKAAEEFNASIQATRFSNDANIRHELFGSRSFQRTC